MGKKNNGILVGILIGLVISLSIVGGLLATNTIKFNTTPKQTSGEIKETTIDNNNKIYSADEYITLEDLSFNSRVTTKKVKLNHLDDSVTSDFYKQQEKVIKSIHPSDSEVFNAEYKLKYGIDNNILSIIYTIEESNEIGTCAITKAVTNIDLVNNKIVTEEELLQKVGTNYKKIVEDAYENELKSWKEMNDYNGRKIDYYEVTYDDFANNKEKYVNIGMEKISDIIYTYVEDGKVKYDYYTITMGTIFHEVGKGGCFNWDTVEVGEYK